MVRPVMLLRERARLTSAVAASLTAPFFFLSGCASVGIQDQGFLAKSNMQFSDSPVGNADGSLLSQIEPGSAGSGGSQAGGCVACK